MFTKTICSLLVLSSAAQGFKFTGPDSDSLDLASNITITWERENKTSEKLLDLFWYTKPDDLHTMSIAIESNVNISKGEYIWSPSDGTREELREHDSLTKDKLFRFEANVRTKDDENPWVVFSDNYTLTGLEEPNAGSSVMPVWGLVAGGLAAAGLMMA